MINSCIDNKRPFGVVLREGESFRRVGCSAVINEVIERYDDGRLDILTIGADRFRIDSVEETGLYLEAHVEYLDEVPEEGEQELVKEAVKQVSKYAFYSEISLDQRSLSALTATQLSYLIAGLDIIGTEIKQELLEIDQPQQRLSYALTALKNGIAPLVAEAQIKKMTGTDIDISGLMN
jgi:Lon protease-like protein